MFNPFHPEPSPGFLSLECLTDELRYPKRYLEMLLQCGPLGEVWMTMEDNGFYFPFGVWGTLSISVYVLRGACPCAPAYAHTRRAGDVLDSPLSLFYLMPLRQGLPLSRGSLCFACAQWWAVLEIFPLHLLPMVELQVSAGTHSSLDEI